VHELKLHIIQVQQWLTDISATRGRDGLNDGFDEAEANAEKTKQLLRELIDLDSDNSTTYRDIASAFDPYYEVGRRMAQAYIDEGPTGGNKMMAEFDEVAATIGEKIDPFVEEAQLRSNELLEAQRVQTQAMKLVVITGTIIVLIMIVIAYFSLSRVFRFLPVIVSDTQNIAAGDLSSETHDWCGGNDELGSLCSNLYSTNGMKKSRASSTALRSVNTPRLSGISACHSVATSAEQR